MTTDELARTLFDLVDQYYTCVVPPDDWKEEVTKEIATAIHAHERAVWEEAAKGAEADLTGDPEDAVNVYLRDYADWCRQRAEEP